MCRWTCRPWRQSRQMSCRSCISIISPSPTLSIGDFCQEAEPQGRLDLDKGGERVLFFRRELDTHMRCISAGEHAFLVSLCRGGAFATACQAGLDEEPGFDVQ